MSTDAVAIIGFLALFVLMLLRVPVGMAMGLVGVSGFAYLNGGAPALKLVGQTSMRTVTDYTFGVIPMFLLMGAFVTHSGMGDGRFDQDQLTKIIKDNAKDTLLIDMTLFVCGNILSALATDLRMFAVARFISGVPQGAYFGAGAVVASYIVGPGHGGKAFALVMELSVVPSATWRNSSAPGFLNGEPAPSN